MGALCLGGISRTPSINELQTTDAPTARTTGDLSGRIMGTLMFRPIRLWGRLKIATTLPAQAKISYFLGAFRPAVNQMFPALLLAAIGVRINSPPTLRTKADMLQLHIASRPIDNRDDFIELCGETKRHPYCCPIQAVCLIIYQMGMQNVNTNLSHSRSLTSTHFAGRLISFLAGTKINKLNSSSCYDLVGQIKHFRAGVICHAYFPSSGRGPLRSPRGGTGRAQLVGIKKLQIDAEDFRKLI